MRLRVIEQLSVPGTPGKANEDVAGAKRLSAWVLDGATGLGERPLLSGESDAEWLANAFNTRLLAEADRVDRDLSDLFRDMITDVAAEFATKASRTPAGRYEEPSAGMAIARLRAETLEFASLGDCRAMLSVDGRVISTADSPVLRTLDAEIISKMRDIRAEHPLIDIQAVSDALRGDLRANRSKLNTDDGYWVLGIEPAAAGVIEVQSVPQVGAESTYGLLVSDGFYRLVDVFEAFPDDAALLHAARQRGLEELMAKLRALEDEDLQCRERMRIKPKDDATALVFEVCDDG